MPQEIINREVIATAFVDLVMRYLEWRNVKELSIQEYEVLAELLREAGFTLRRVRPGKLRGDYRAQDGDTTGETYPINDHCNFKVVGKDGHDDSDATAWLDAAIERVGRGAGACRETHSEIIEAIMKVVEDNIPLVPITLNIGGDTLCEMPSLGGFGGNPHKRDYHKFDSITGVHKYCGGVIERRGATKIRDALVCRGCCMRILFPKRIETLGELRREIQSFGPPDQ